LVIDSSYYLACFFKLNFRRNLQHFIRADYIMRVCTLILIHCVCTVHDVERRRRRNWKKTQGRSGLGFFF
jgi:hypothetical protein